MPESYEINTTYNTINEVKYRVIHISNGDAEICKEYLRYFPRKDLHYDIRKIIKIKFNEKLTISLVF
jgi:hypothetical protein